MAVNKGVGRMESDVSISKMLRTLADIYDSGSGTTMSGAELHAGEEAAKAKCICRSGDWSYEKQRTECVKQGGHYKYENGLVVSFIPESKNHNGKPMMFIGNISDVSTCCLEISEEGMFAYYVDDGVS